VKFFETLRDGFRTPLDAVQISGLFEAGYVGGQTRCNPTQRAESHTIDELFPLLNYGSSREFVRRSPAVRSPFRLSLSAAIALVPLGAVATAVIGYLFFGAQPSVASPVSIMRAGSPAALSSPALPKKTQTKNKTPGKSKG
jgi:hypothetical protein